MAVPVSASIRAPLGLPATQKLRHFVFEQFLQPTLNSGPSPVLQCVVRVR